MSKDDFIRDENGNIQYLCDGEIIYPEAEPITAESISKYIEFRKNIGIELSPEEIKQLWESLSEWFERGSHMKKYISFILALFIILTSMLTVNASSTIVSTVGGSSAGGTSSGGSSSGGGGGSSKPVTPVFPYTKCNFKGTIYLPENEVAPEYGLELEISFPVVSSSDVSYGAGTVGVSQAPTTLIIPSGENNVSYDINWYVRNDTESLAVKVNLKTNPDEKYLYGNLSDVIEIDFSETIVADVYIEYPDSFISGCFSLGEDAELLSEKISIKINLENTDGMQVYSNAISLLPNTRTVDFKIPVKQGEEYILNYTVNATTMNQQHISPDTIEYADTIVVASEEISGIVLEPVYRDVISGTISLPNGMKAPEGGLKIQISGASVLQVVIPENENSVEYIVAKDGDTYFTPIQDNYNEIRYKEFVLDENSSENNIQLDPIHSVYGTISIPEVAIDDINLNICASLNEIPDTDRWDAATSITIPEGSSSATYCIEIDNGCLIDDVYVAVFDDTYSDKYIHFGGAFSEAVQLLQYNNEYSFGTLNIEKAVEVFKGTIHIPKDFVALESRIRIEAYNTTQDLGATVWTDGKNDTVEFVIYGETSNFDIYNGEYVFRLIYDDYSWFDIYYNSGSFSVQNKSGVTVNNETTVMDIVLPERNLSLSGMVILPTAATEEIEVVMSLYDQYGFSVGDRIITVPANTTSYNFSTSFLARTDIGNYRVSYSISNANTSPYAEGRIVYLAENDYTENIDNAKEITASGSYSDITVNLSPFECSAIIKGSITIPFGIVPSTNTYFNVKVVATNGEYEENDIVRFSAGESTNEYSIAIPEMYSDGDWQIYYIIGSASSIPSAPTIKTEVIRDSDFSIPESTSGGGGNGVGGGGVIYPIKRIPARIINGINVYYSSSGMVFDEKYATTFTFDGEEYSNIDFTVVTMDMEFPRNIGGYFLSTKKDDVEFTVELIDYETGKSVDEKNYVSTDEATWYEFNITGEKSYILKFYYEDKEYYYNSSKLTTDEDNAFVIEATSDPNQYKYNVYYENIQKYYQTTNQRYLNFDFEDEKYPNVNVCIFDKNGMLIDKNYAGTLNTEEDSVYIGIEYCGQIRYLQTLNKKSARNNILSETTEDITEARTFTLPHISENNIVVTIDISDFVSGTSTGFDGATLVNESYLNYEILSNGYNVESIYVDIADGVLDGSNTLYIAFYGAQGQLTDLESVTELPADKTIPLNFFLEKDGHIKIMCFQPQLQPMFDVVQFFE